MIIFKPVDLGHCSVNLESEFNAQALWAVPGDVAT